jgi:hypothetical protein
MFSIKEPILVAVNKFLEEPIVRTLQGLNVVDKKVRKVRHKQMMLAINQDLVRAHVSCLVLNKEYQNEELRSRKCPWCPEAEIT